MEKMRSLDCKSEISRLHEVSRFCVWIWVLSLPNLKCTTLKKARSMVVNGANQKFISIYLYLSNISSGLGILRSFAWGNASVFQKAGATRGMQGLRRLTLRNGWLFITLKNVKEYFQCAPKELKPWRINKHYKVNSKLN